MPACVAPIGPELERRGFAVRRSVVPRALVAELATAIDRAVETEAADFPVGDPQHGRLLCAPEHGGAFIDLLDHDRLFTPIEELLGDDAIVYLMTTSVLDPGSAGAVEGFHTDVPPDRPPGLVLAALVMVDRFVPASGATEFVVGSHREDRGGEVVGVRGDPGDVVYFDPQVSHRSTRNTTDGRRRAVVLAMVPPWMKQRIDVAAVLPATARPGPRARRRLGVDARPPRSRAEFLARRDQRPWRT